MNQKDNQDFLKDLDWSGVYANVPESVSAGARYAFLRIRQREKKRRFVIRSLSAAAAVVLMLGVGVFALRSPGKAPDIVAAPEISVHILQNSDHVYAARADDYFHIRSDCSAAMAEQVELQLVTALEFDKEKCMICGAEVILAGGKGE